jgi:hypothetical protein
MLNRPELRESELSPTKTERALRAFDDKVLPELFGAASEDRETARAAIAHIRHKLEQLEALLPSGAPPASTLRGAHEASWDAGSVDDTSGLGRNQKAKLRELALLEILANLGRATPIQMVMGEVESRGFKDGQPAVNAHLHRLVKLDLLETPGPGMFVITRDGREHLHKLKAGIGQLAR